MIAVLAALFQGSLAQKNLFAEFGSCEFSSCSTSGATCCPFVQQTGAKIGNKADFCMTDAQQ